MSTSRLFVDMIAVTVDVESTEERKAIHKRIRDYKNDRVTKRFIPHFSRSNYHTSYQLEVSPGGGEPFTIKISYNPLDGHLENGKRRFLRVEFNPRAVGSRMWILRRVLCRLLGEGVVGRLLTASVVTRLDLAVDFKGMNEELYLYSTNARKSRVVHGEHSVTQYVGGRRSRVKIRYYDKAAETLARGGVSDESDWYRLEVQVKDRRCAPAELADELKNPFVRLRFYDGSFLDGSCMEDEDLEERFHELVYDRGLNAAFRAGPSVAREKAGYLAWLEGSGFRVHLFDAAEVWQDLDQALAVLNGLWEESKQVAPGRRRRPVRGRGGRRAPIESGSSKSERRGRL